MYLRSDCYHQYTPYLEILQEKLKGEGSLFYTWQIGAGMNFIGIAAYYLSSPLNLLTILWPGNMADIVSFFIILKMGLAGFATAYYLSKKFKKNDISIVAFGMFYALSAYFAAFSWNIMWLDCMWLLPFIILGLERLVNEKRYKMYCISLALAIFSNYYIGIMLCIYSVIYFIYLICTADIDSEANKIKTKLLMFKDFALYSLLAGGMAACVILPEYFNLLITKSAESEFPAALEEYFSILYMLFRSLICIPIADLKYPYDPNIYCTVAIFILIPLFWLCKKIDIKHRVGKTVIMVLMLLSFNLNIPNYIWHGLHFPNSLPCRESFIYIFLIITMAYEAFIHIRRFKPVHIIGSAGGAIGLILILQEFFKDTSFFDDLSVETDIVKIIYLSLFFIVLYLALIMYYKKRPDLKNLLSYFMILAVFCELTLNMSVTGISSSSSRSEYYVSTKAYETLNDFAKKDAQKEGTAFYRTEGSSHATRNDGARFSYNSISTFCSTASAAMQDYYDTIGLQTSYNAYSYYGHTPLTAALFSIKYEYTDLEPSLPDSMALVSSQDYTDTNDAISTLNLYKYNNTLPLGFLINSSTMANWDNTTGNPFMTQNNFLTSANNEGSTIFHKLKSNSVGSFTAQYDLDEEDDYKLLDNSGTFDVYFYCNTTSETLTATVSDDDSLTQTFSSTNQNYICHLGKVNPGATITITASEGQTITECYAYAFDESAWEENFQLLNANPYNVESFSDTKITGTITADTTKVMYTSIPYDKGWKVYIDDVESKTIAICDDALTGVLVSPGTHEITFKYCPQGFAAGITLSIICLLAFIAFVFKDNIIKLFRKK